MRRDNRKLKGCAEQPGNLSVSVDSWPMGPSSPHSARVRLAECCWGSSFYQPRVNLSLGGFELTILLCLPSTGITHAPLTASGVTVILVWRRGVAEMEKDGFKLKWWHLGGDLQDNNGILG